MLKELYSFICEDLRQEKSGKYIIIGTYFGGQIFIKSIPNHMPTLVLFHILHTSKIGEFPFTCDLINKELNEVIFAKEGMAKSGKLGEMTLSFRFENVPINSYGLYVFETDIKFKTNVEETLRIRKEFLVLDPKQPERKLYVAGPNPKFPLRNV